MRRAISHSEIHYGDLVAPGNQEIYSLFPPSKDQTGILTNIGSAAYWVVIEHGLRWQTHSNAIASAA